MATLAEIRAQYPGAYDHVDDQTLADALYRKHYSHADRQEFDARIGLKPYAGGGEIAAKAVLNLPQSIIGSGHSAAQLLAEGVKDAVTAETAPAPAPSTLSPAERLRAQQAGEMPMQLSGGAPVPVGEVAAGLLNVAANATGTADEIAAGADAVARDQIARRAASDAWLAENAPNMRPGSLEEFGYGVVQSGADMVGPMSLSILMRNPAPMAAYGAFRSGSEGYAKAREAGLEPDQARVAAGLYAATEAIGEALGTGVLLKGGKTLVGAVLKGMASEGLSEAATEAMQAMVDAGIIGEEMTLAQVAERIGKAGAAGAILGGPFAVAGHVTKPRTPADPNPVVEPQREPEDDAEPVPEQQLLALPKPGEILALPAPEAFVQPPRRHPEAPEGAPVEQLRSEAAERDVQARLALQRNRQTETAELLELARETITPIGAFTPEELGEKLTGQIKARRVRTGRPLDAPITAPELAAAKVPQAQIDALLAIKRPRSSSEILTPSTVRAAAAAKNILIDANFAELALRATGSKAVERMSQAQLNALVTTLDTMPRQEKPVSIPVATMPEFTEGQYDAAVSKLRDDGRYSFEAVKAAAGTKNTKIAAEIRDAMVRRGQLVHRGGSSYRLYDVAGAERQPTPDDLPKGAFSEYTVKKMPARQIRVKQDGKSIGTFDSANAARDAIRNIRSKEAESGKAASQIQLTHDAEAEAYAVMENRYDENGVLLGQVPVNSSRSRVEAERMAGELTNPTTLPAEATTPVTTRLAYRSNKLREAQQAQAAQAPKPGRKARKPAPPGLAGREREILDKVKAHVVSRALPLLGVKTNLVSFIKTPDGRYAEGRFFQDVIDLATAHFSPTMSIDEIADTLAGLIDHELIHALRMAGVLKPGSDAWKTLATYVNKARRPTGEAGAGQTYLDFARQEYAGLPGYDNAEAIMEEAIAEAFRMWAANKRNVSGKPAGIFRQLVQWFRELTLAIPEDIFTAISTGDMVRQALVPPGSSQPRAVANKAMRQAKAAAATATETPVVQARSREFIRARQQAREDRFGRSGPKTVIGTDASRAYNAGALGDRSIVQTILERFNAKAGRSSAKLPTYLPEPMDFLRKVADLQQRSSHAPIKADVARAYNALLGETKAMFQALEVTVSRWTEDGEPYANPAEMLADVAAGRLRMRLSEDMFGEGPDNAGHPMLRASGFRATDDTELSNNDIFRAVHEVYGRGQSGFRGTARDDYNAYHEHARLVSAEALPALATETLAQSAWHHYGPHLRRADGTIPTDDDLDYLPSEQREWAEQKAFLIPDAVLRDDPGFEQAKAADGAVPMYMVAWHGTPHDVDKFTTAKIGTGEGAQSFGWGLYFAGNREVAEHYKRKLSSDGVLTFGGKRVTPGNIDQFDPMMKAVWNDFMVKGGDPVATLAMIEEKVDGWEPGRMKDYETSKLEWLRANFDQFKLTGGGRLYKVEVPEHTDLIDYDATWDKQSASVREKLQTIPMFAPTRVIENEEKRLFRPSIMHWFVSHRSQYGTVYTEEYATKAEAEAAARKEDEKRFKNWTGADLYNRLSQSYRNSFLPGISAKLGTSVYSYADRMASERLREAGIPGHMFFDAFSRRGANGTRNYVVYDDNAVDITARYSVGKSDKLKALMEANAGLKGVVKHLTPDEVAKVKAQNAAALVEIFTSLPDPKEMAAVAYAARAKRGWYQKSAEALVKIFGVNDAPRFAALLAATSPQTSVENNSITALQMWTGWIKAGRPTDREAILKVMGENAIGGRGIDSVLPAWINNSLTALQTPDPASIVLSGPKVNSFMLNLRGVVDEVTNDAWMANYALVEQELFRKTGPTPGKGVGYIAMNAAVRKAAEAATRLTGDRWTPEQIQETVWSWAKTLYEKANSTTSAEEILAAGQLTHEEISTTPDFASLFAGGVYRNILEKGGYADALTTLNGGDGSDGRDGLRGSVGDATGSGFAQDAFSRHLRRAARRLDQLRANRNDAERAGSGRDAGPQGDLGSRQAAPDRLPGLPASSPGPNAHVIAAARRYLAGMGLPLRRQAIHVKADPDRGARIAAAYEEMKHDPENPRVLAAYKRMIEEVKAQYKAAIDSGLVVEIIRGDDPYPEGPKQVLADLQKNHLWVYPTDAGFGTLNAIKDNPLLAPTEFMVGDHRMVANDLFRVVHDYFGHGLEGAGFGASGEENAWQAHMRMFSPEAALAMTSETRGQNSWVNYGPYGEQNRTNQRETVYADQKVGLLPEWVLTDGVADDQSETGLNLEPVRDRLPGGARYGTDHSPGAALAHPEAPALAFTANRDGNQWFAGDFAAAQIQMAIEGIDGTMLTYMSTEEFLALTQGDHPEQNIFDAAAAEGLRFTTIPSIVVDGFAGNVRVVGSDGRYAAQALNTTVAQLPVVIYSKAKKEMGLVTGLEPMRPAAPKYSVGSPAFQAWFKDSKVVDANGKPLKVYHGSLNPEGFEEGGFSYSWKGSNDFGGDADIGFFFTSDPKVANAFAERDGGVVPAYLSLQKPMQVEGEVFKSMLEQWSHSKFMTWKQTLLRHGHDGVIVSEIPGDNGTGWVQFDAPTYIVFEPPQVKSAISNTGAYSPTNPDIRYSIVPMKPRAEHYPADREQGQPKFSMAAAFGQRVPADNPPPMRNIVRQRNEGVIGKFLHSVGRSKRNLPGLGASVFDLRIKLNDSQLAVKEMIEELEDAGGRINDANHTYMQGQLYHGKVQNQLSYREEHVYQPLFDALRDASATDKISVAEFEDYLYAKHAPERNAYLRTRGSKLENPSGMSDEDALAIIDKAATSGKRARLEELAKLAYAITADTTKTRNEAGLISDEAAKGSPFRFYVPLRGFAEEDLDPELNGSDTAMRARTGRGFTIGGKEDKSVTGRDRKAGDILGHLLLQNTESVIRAEKNAVALSFMRLLKENPDSGYGTILESKPTRRVVGPNGMIHEAGDPNFKNDPTIVTAKYKGGEIVARVEPRVARALRGDGVAAVGNFVRFMGGINRFLATVNTSMNPEFLISNLARDLQQSAILAQQYDIKNMGREITGSVPGAIRGIFRVLRDGDAATGEWEDAFREMQAAGGTIEFMGLHDIDTMVKKLQRGVTAAGLNPTPRQALNQIQNLFGLINDTNAAVENALRLGAFVAARKAGVSNDQAAFLAKNLTVNFNKGGEWKTTANAMYLFYNASIAGSTAMVQGLKNKKVQAIAGAVIAAGVMLDAVNRALSDDEDKNGVKDYDEVPEYILERNIVVMLPGQRNYVAVPMPYGFNAFFNAGRNLGNMFSGSPVHNPGKSVQAIGLGFLGAFNPLGGVSSILNFIAPTFADPLVDYATNTDFTGRDIVPDRMDVGGVPVPESQKYWSTTNPAYLWVAEKINALTGGDKVASGQIDFSPETYEQATDFFLGGAGKFMLRLGTLGAAAVAGNWQDVQTDDVVFTRKVVGSVNNRGNTEIYYNNAQEILTLKARLEMYAEEGNGEMVKQILAGNRSRVPLIGLVEQSSKDLAALRKQIREAREAPIPETRRREIIKQLQARMDQIMAATNRAYFRVTNPQTP